MKNNQVIWKKWIAVLHNGGLHEITAALLEVTGPLNFLGAQVVYLCQPILNIFFQQEEVVALADLLDSPAEARIFIDTLRQII